MTNGLLSSAQTLCLYLSPSTVDSSFYVLFAEILKFLISAPRVPLKSWKQVIFDWRILFLAIAYVIQNTLVVSGKKSLPPSVATILSQQKIVTTFCAQYVLGQVSSELIPVVVSEAAAMGLAVSLSTSSSSSLSSQDTSLATSGVIALASAAIMSALNGIWTAHLLRGKHSYWPTNLGLSSWGAFASLLRCMPHVVEFRRALSSARSMLMIFVTSALLGSVGLLLSLLLSRTSPLTKTFSSMASVGISMLLSGVAIHDVQSPRFYLSCLIVISNTIVYSLMSKDVSLRLVSSKC